MAEVLLTATNPEDSSVVPVACNSKGELLLEEPIDQTFDGNLDGDLTVSGSGTFAGDVEIDGVIKGRQSSAELAVFAGYYSGSDEPILTSEIDGNGNINVGAGGKVNVSQNSATACGAKIESAANGGQFISQYTTSASAYQTALQVFRGSLNSLNLLTTGAATFAENKAGITAGGELYFYSRGERYKAVVQNGNMMADVYTLKMEQAELQALEETLKAKTEELESKKSNQ